MPKLQFTVIVVTFKRIEELNKAIESVTKQTLTNYECLIFNDFPSDNAQIEKKVDALKDDRFKFFSSDQTKGANHWRNYGIQMAEGEFLAFLDDDDQWFPEKLAEHYHAHRQNNAFLVYSDYIKRWSDESKPNLIEINSPLLPNICEGMAKGTFSISTTSSVTLRNEVEGSLFDESLKSFQDWDAWFNLARSISKPKLFRIQRPLLYFTQHKGNRTSKNYERRWEALSQLKSKYNGLGINIDGFFYKEKLNLLLLKTEHLGLPHLFSIIYVLVAMLRYPRFFRYKYSYKRIGRFIFTRNR